VDSHARGIIARKGAEEAADVGRFAPRLLLLPRLDPLITRVFYCPQPWAVPSIRHVDPNATFLPDWPTFAAAFAGADVGVVLCDPSGGDDLAARLAELTHKHRLPSVVVVVTHLDAEHLLPFRRIAVDEFVPLASMATDLPEAVPRSVIAPLREHLALHVERLERCGPELRFALAWVLRQPTGIRTIRELAAAARVTPRTLENQWKVLGGDEEVRLQDLLWMIRLLEALQLRGTGASLRGICEALDLDLRSLQRAGRRHLTSSLGRVSATDAAAELLWLRRRILNRLGSSAAGGQLRRIRGSPTAALSSGGGSQGGAAGWWWR
jgi:hypothetical protein